MRMEGKVSCLLYLFGEAWGCSQTCVSVWPDWASLWPQSPSQHFAGNCCALYDQATSICEQGWFCLRLVSASLNMIRACFGVGVWWVVPMKGVCAVALVHGSLQA